MPWQGWGGARKGKKEQKKLEWDLVTEKQEIRQREKVIHRRRERRGGKAGKETWNRWVLETVLELNNSPQITEVSHTGTKVPVMQNPR